KAARCIPSVLVIVAVVSGGGPIAVKTRLYGVLALPEACLEICLEAWSLCFFAYGVHWVKFPCFVILGFGSVLSVGSHRWRQSCALCIQRIDHFQNEELEQIDHFQNEQYLEISPQNYTTT
ncbi:hypothetical protein Tco_1071727, partial [Tanacetum coccineum]